MTPRGQLLRIVQERVVADSLPAVYRRRACFHGRSSRRRTKTLSPPMTNPVSWLLRVSESKTNYWATYVVDFSLLSFFLYWDATRTSIGPAAMTALFALGVFAWTLTEYAFHRWVYHLGFAITRAGHEKHHDDPTAYIAMPFPVTPILFLPIQWVVAVQLSAHGFSSVLAGFFGGFIAYSFMHH